MIQNTMNKLKTYILEHKIITAIVIYLAIMLVVTIIVILVMPTTTGPNNSRTEFDPASERNIQVSDNTGVADASGPIWVGFDDMLGQHSSNWIISVRRMISSYAFEQQINLDRVSLVKNSFHQVGDRETPLVSHFEIVLNIDQTRLRAVVSFTNIGILVKFFDTNDNLVFERETEINNASRELSGTLPDRWFAIGNFDTIFVDEIVLEDGTRLWEIITDLHSPAVPFKLAPGFNPPTPTHDRQVRLFIANPVQTDRIDWTSENNVVYKYIQF